MSFYRDFNDKVAIEGWNGEPRAAFRTIQVTRSTPTIGAEVAGVDLRRPLPDEQLTEIRRALAENLVLVFRNQPIDREDHKRFGRYFGTLHSHLLGAARTPAGEEHDPEILAWRTTRASRFTAGDGWHNDVSCDPRPIFASALRVRELPGVGGGDTAFANLILAYESLSEPVKRLVEGLTAIHDGSRAWTAGYGEQPAPGTSFPSAEHPVVARHPLSGRKFLYVNPSFTTHIVQLARPESDAILDLLYRHISGSLWLQTRIHWTPDSLVLWDNWATAHHAVWDYYPDNRWGERVSAVLDHGPEAAVR